MLGGREALTGIAMRGTTPMPIRKVVALADDELDDARVLGGLCALPDGRQDAEREQLDRPARNTCTSQPIVAKNLRESLGKMRAGVGRRGDAHRRTCRLASISAPALKALNSGPEILQART